MSKIFLSTIFLILSACGQNTPPEVIINNIPPADGDQVPLSVRVATCSGTNGATNFGPSQISSITQSTTADGRRYYDIITSSPAQFFRVFGTCTVSN